MWRQGDIFIAPGGIPESARASRSTVLAEGEVTGHAHRLSDASAATLFIDEAEGLFLSVTADEAVVAHEEHASVTLPRGDYRVWRQREYSPEAIHIVRD